MKISASCASICEQLGIAENTLSVFLSDNGGSPGGSPAQVAAGAVAYSLNTPFRGCKGECYEGGIRIPYMVEWPGKIRGGVTSDVPVSSLDILPTALAAAGAPPAPHTDGVDLLPFFKGPLPTRRTRSSSGVSTCTKPPARFDEAVETNGQAGRTLRPAGRS